MALDKRMLLWCVTGVVMFVLGRMSHPCPPASFLPASEGMLASTPTPLTTGVHVVEHGNPSTAAADEEVLQPSMHHQVLAIDDSEVKRKTVSGSLFSFPSTQPPKRKLVALLTYLRDEETHLRMWFAHYRKFFDLEDIYILDNESKEPVMSLGLGQGVHVKTFACPKGKYFDHYCLIEHVQRAVDDLLTHYKFIVFTEVDELMAAKDGLRNYICSHKEHPVTRPVGFELLQAPSEGPLDYLQPILPQRSTGVYNYFYNKPAIFSKPLPFITGFHSYIGAPKPKGKSFRNPEVRKGLYLIHLKYADHFFCVRRRRWQQQQAFYEKDVKKHRGVGYALSQLPRRADGDISDDALLRLCTGPSVGIHNVSDTMRRIFEHSGGRRGWCE